MRRRTIATLISCALVAAAFVPAGAGVPRAKAQPYRPGFEPSATSDSPPTGSAAIGSVNPLRTEAATIPQGGPTADVGAADAQPVAPPNGAAPAASPGVEPSATPATDLASPGIPPVAALTPVELQRRREALDDQDGLDPALKTKADEIFAQAAKEVEAATQEAGLAASYDAEIASVDAKREALKREAETLEQTNSAPRTSPEGGQENLEALLEKAKQEHAAAVAKQDELSAEPTRRATRKTAIPKELADAQAQLEQATAKLAAYTGDGDAPAVAAAQRTLLQAQVQRLEAAIRKLQRESAYYSATAPLLPLQQDLATRRAALGDKEVKRLGELLTQRMHKEVRELADKAEESSQKLPEQLQPIVERIKKRAEESADLVTDLERVRKLQDQVETNTDRWRRDFQRVKEKLELVGMSQAMGILLQNTRRRMTKETSQFVRPPRDEPSRVVEMEPDPSGADGVAADAAAATPEPLDATPEILENLPQLILDARLELMTLEEERARLRSPQAIADEYVEQIVQESEGALPMPEDVLLAETVNLLKQDREQLDLLIKYQSTYFEELVDLETLRQANAQLIDEYRAFIDERILWTPSATLGTLFDPTTYSEAVAWLTDVRAWRQALELWKRAVLSNPWIELLVLAIFLPFLIYQRRLRKLLAGWADKASRPTCQKIAPTLLAVAVTGLLALPWALLPGFAALRLLSLPEQSELTFALGRAFFALAWWSFYVQFLRHLLRTKGLADAHFFWSGPSRKRLRSYVLSFYPLSAPLVFLIVILHVQNEETIQNGPGRALAIGLLLLLAIYAHAVFRPSGPWANRSPAVGGGVWEYRMRWIVWGLTTLSPIALAGLSLAGYHYTAMRLSAGFVETAILLTGLLLFRATITRWMLLHRRRLAFEQARARLQQATLEGETESRALENLGVTPAERQTLDLNQLSEQGRRLVSVVVGFAACVGLLLIWQDVLPALNLLDQAVLVEDDSGVAARDVTLLSVALAIASFVLMVVAIRNIPGLLELFVLPRLPMDAGARYATTTIARYVIMLVGIVSTAWFVGIEWSQYQWLVGAAAVGLGFGLQEIFANFVSGLILLFERPVRVGDIVTIEGVTGAVTKIRMRATTVVNWDNQEYIVPNKDFVTGKLLNWTLTNERNRITITVGISYDDDPDVARRILLEAADEMEFVMKDPAPMATFEGFDESSLRLVLRCHLETLEHRLDTTHELHAAINRKFREAKLSIPFPQRDLHFRSPMTVHSNGSGNGNGKSNGDGADGRASEPAGELPERRA